MVKYSQRKFTKADVINDCGSPKIFRMDSTWILIRPYYKYTTGHKYYKCQLLLIFLKTNRQTYFYWKCDWITYQKDFLVPRSFANHFLFFLKRWRAPFFFTAKWNTCGTSLKWCQTTKFPYLKWSNKSFLKHMVRACINTNMNIETNLFCTKCTLTVSANFSYIWKSMCMSRLWLIFSNR